MVHLNIDGEDRLEWTFHLKAFRNLPFSFREKKSITLRNIVKVG